MFDERFRLPRYTKETVAVMAALAFAGCGSKKDVSTEAVSTGSGIAVEAKTDTKPESTPVAAKNTPEAPADATLQELCDPAFTYDVMSVAPGTVVDLLKTRWIQPNSDVTKEDVISNIYEASIAAGPDADSETPVAPDDQLPANTQVSISFAGACDS